MTSLPLPLAAFVAGLISFLSPCVLPLVPGYVSLISGAGIEELKSSEGHLLRKLMINSAAFIIGFSVVFITLGAISTEVKELAARARARKLKPADYQGGSSTISNLGMYGVDEFSAIIVPPHATILAIGAARRQAIERDDGGVAFASMLRATLSCDHRLVDGAVGAALLAAVKALIETPLTMLV